MANLIEALKSKKVFRACNHGTLYKPYNGNLDMQFTVAEILSEYQIEEEKVEITKSQLVNVWERNINSSRPSPTFDRFAEALGFKP